jgi:hypothetical protein
MNQELPDPVADAAVQVGQKVRYLRLHRTSGDDFMQENLLEAYNGNHTNEYLTFTRLEYSFRCPPLECRRRHNHPTIR